MTQDDTPKVPCAHKRESVRSGLTELAAYLRSCRGKRYDDQDYQVCLAIMRRVESCVALATGYADAGSSRLEHRRAIATRVAWSYLGHWYKWGGDDPAGFDCSGFVIEILKSAGALPRAGDWTAQALWNRFKDRTVKTPGEGCLVFWQSSSRIIHVEYCLTRDLAIGASGGGAGTRTVADAADQNAFIKIRPILSRSGIAGFVDPFKEV